MKWNRGASALAGGLAFLGAAFGAEKPAEAGNPFVGVDANYSLGMEKDGVQWRWDGRAEDLFRGIAASGVKGFRLRLWTGDEGPNGKAYTTEVMRRARAAGLEPYLVIFLSENWADLTKQPVPAIWKDLSFAERREAVRKYSAEVVRHFRAEGLRSHLYEIGNEIDYGICGVFPSKGAKKDPAALSRSCWPQAAEIIRASQQGVREADPDAKFLLHISHWWDPEFCVAFFRFMLAHGVQVDFAGLSYFPSSNIGGSIEMAQFGDVVRQLHGAIARPIIVPESGYPSSRDFSGQFSRWKYESPGYPLTPEGQERWVREFLDFCASEPAIDSVYYWSPEWCGEGMWKAFALFDPKGNARPAWAAFSGARADRPRPRRPVYFEADGEGVHRVPVAEAREKAAPVLRGELKRFGRVNVDYIKAITTADLVVGDYRVNLRATLSGNLDLMRIPGKGGAPAKDAFESVNAASERAVLFAREPDAPATAEALAAAKKRGLEVVLHPKAADAALKFGLGADPPAAADGKKPAP